MSAGGRIYTLDSEASWLSVLGCGWGLRAEEVATECLMTGTKCITEAESAKAKELQASTLFGEVLYKGICNLAKPEMLDLSNQKTLRVIEIGAGLGKAAAQLFFQFPHVVRVLGVEFVASRAQIARDAFSKLADHARSVRVETKAGASRGYQFRTFTETIKKVCGFFLNFCTCAVPVTCVVTHFGVHHIASTKCSTILILLLCVAQIR